MTDQGNLKRETLEFPRLRSPLAVVENSDLIVKEEVAIVEPWAVSELDCLCIPINVQHHPQRAVGIHSCIIKYKL